MKKLLILTAMLFTVLFVGCNDEAQIPDITTAVETEATSVDFVLSDDILVVRSDNASEVEIKAASALKKGIEEKTGVSLTLTTDWTKSENKELAEREILVGTTIREESSVEGLENGDYSIRLVGSKIIIIGHDARATEKAVQRFLDDCVDENGFTFGGELDLIYDSSAAMLSEVPDNMKGTLTINFDEIINPDIIGGGVNFDFSSYVFMNLVNGGEWEVRSQHIPYSTDEAKLEKLWEEYFDMIDYTGMQYIRLCVSMTMWEPINDNEDPFDTDFESGFVFSPKFSERPDAQGEGAGFPALNYAYLEAFYKLLDHFEEKGLYVILGNWDNGSEALGFCPDNTNWLASTDANGNKLGRGDDLNVVSLDEYAETFAAIMYHLVEEKGYTCVKGFSFYNEPEHLKGGQDILVAVYNKFDEHLKRLGIREKTMIQAFDSPVFWMAADNGNANRIDDMNKECGDAMDIIGYHVYLATVESGEKVEGKDVRGTVSTYLIPEVEKMIEQADGRPVVVSELGTFAFSGSASSEESGKDYMTRVFAAEAAIELFNCGAKGYGLWIYNCYLHKYYTMLSYDKSNPQRLIPDEVNYYPSSLIMKHLPGGTDIVASEVVGCEDDYKHVWATAGIRPDGTSAIMLVNDGAEPAQLTLEGTEGKPYKYYYVDADHTDNIYEDGTVEGEVLLRPYSIVVLVEE